MLSSLGRNFGAFFGGVEYFSVLVNLWLGNDYSRREKPAWLGLVIGDRRDAALQPDVGVGVGVVKKEAGLGRLCQLDFRYSAAF